MIARAASRSLRSTVVILAAALAACGKDAPSDPSNLPGSLSANSPVAITGPAGGTIDAGASVLVRARNGRPLAGIPVTFVVAEGAGTVGTPTTRTDARGIASSGRWTLGTTAGPQRLMARVERLDSISFTATARPGAPASVMAPSVAVASGTVGTLMATPPSVVVRDIFANPVPGAPVTFTVRSGGGTATGTERVTDSQGVATLGSLRLGTRSGAQDVGVHVAGVPEFVLTVAAVAGPAEVLRLLTGADQITHVGSALDVAPTLSARDAYDNPVARRAVTARIAQGGGSVGGDMVTADDGTITLDRWTMGYTEGLNALTLDVDGLSMTVFAKAVPTSSFNIQFRYLSSVTDRQRASFERAAARWRKVIVGEVGDVSVASSSFCGVQGSALNEIVDDLVIFVQIVPIDGPGKILGSAGPCAYRLPGGIPAVGAMRFDSDDVAQMEAGDRFGDVVLHEIGHILGLGTMWKYHQLLADAGGEDPYYLGVSGRAGFVTVGGAMYTGNTVPVENTGGPGTRDGHWRESVLNAEVMTGFVEQPGVRMPLSLLTIGALEDLGYLITTWGDDAYSYSTAPLLSGAIPRRSGAPDQELIEVPFPPPVALTPSGQTSSISTRIAAPPTQRRVGRAAPRPVQRIEVRRVR